MNLHFFSLFAFAFGVLLIAILVWLKRQDTIAMRFLWFSISVSGWAFPTALWISQSFSYDTSFLLSRISHLFNVFIPILWLHFILCFLKKNEPIRYFYPLNYLIAFLLACLSFHPLFIRGMHKAGPLSYFTSPGPLYFLYVAIFGLFMSIGFFHLFHAYFIVNKRDRMPLEILIIATMTGFIAGSTTFIPVYFPSITGPMVLHVALPIYPFLMGVALIRYGLFDVQQIADAFQREKLAALGTMAASLNHELRNPLYIAHGRIDSYLHSKRETDAEVPSKVQEILESAHRQLGRALEIMQRFTDFARPIPRKGSIEKVVIEQTVRDVMDLISNELETRNIQVNTTGLDGQWIQGNKRQVEEIFFNLLLNACQAMGAKGGEIGIVAKEKGNKLVVEVADNGPGMAPDQAEAIFEPFYSTKGEKGSGLGLYITKQLVERNGGRIVVRSKPGDGTAFSLTFSTSGNKSR